MQEKKIKEFSFNAIDVERAEKIVLSSYIHNYFEIINFSELENIPLHFFSRPESRAVYSALLEMEAQERGYDTNLIHENLKKKHSQNTNFLNRCSNYLLTLPRDANFINFRKYLQILRNNWIKKELDELSVEIKNTQLSLYNFDSVLQKWHDLFMNIITKSDKLNYLLSKKVIKSYEELVEKNQKNDNATYLKTGYSLLDDKIRGFIPGQFIVIASRPGVGKTTFALNLIENNLHKISTSAEIPDNNLAVGIFSLEMTNEIIMEKLIAIKSNTSFSILSKIIEGKSVKNQDLEMISAAKKELSKSNILFCEDVNITLNKIIATIKFWKRKYQLKLVVIDYLQLINLPIEKDLANFNTTQRISYISRQLKVLSIEQNICILSLSQLNRKLEERKGLEKIPLLSDLRDSGSIEQDADIVMFLYPNIKLGNENDEESEDEDLIGSQKRTPDQIILKIGKNRHGPVGNVYFKLEKTLGKFSQSRYFKNS